VHGGGYVGAAAHMSFLPEQRIGVVVLANAGDVANAMLDMVSIDVYDRLLGESHDDLLPAYERRAEQWFARHATAPEGDGLLMRDDLTRDPADYVGEYGNPDWGTVVFTLDGDGLRACMGDLALHLSAQRTDRFAASSGSGTVEFDGAFLPGDAAGGEVPVLLLSDDRQVIRFERD